MDYKEIIYDALTNETTVRDYTPEQIKEAQLREKELLAKIEDQENKNAIRQSALSKLIDLGLTEEEIAAL